MKVDIQELSGFDPIKLEITIESKAELQELWHRVNVSDEAIENAMDADGYSKRNLDNLQRLFDVLSGCMDNRDIEP